MAENRTDRDREKESTGDELEERDRTSRQGQNAETDRDRKSAGEPTDTLEDRNLSGSSTWATLPDQDQGENADAVHGGSPWSDPPMLARTDPHRIGEVPGRGGGPIPPERTPIVRAESTPPGPRTDAHSAGAPGSDCK